MNFAEHMQVYLSVWNNEQFRGTKLFNEYSPNLPEEYKKIINQIRKESGN